MTFGIQFSRAEPRTPPNKLITSTFFLGSSASPLLALSPTTDDVCVLENAV